MSPSLAAKWQHSENEHGSQIKKNRAAWLASLGSAIEYYDFVLYALLASYLSQIFFPDNDSLISFVKTLGVFATAYLVRPIGGVFFGIIGDRFGRKKSFTSAILVMAMATLCIGFLPSYSSIGIAAPIMLLGLRILQGLSQGAELPSAITYLAEHANNNQKGMYCGILITSATVGSIFGSLIIYLLTYHFSEQEIIAWAWRLPFLLGGVLGIVGYHYRKHAIETPAFNALVKPQNTSPVTTLVKYYPMQIIQGFLLTFFGACMIIAYLLLPNYLRNQPALDGPTIYGAMTFGYICLILVLPSLSALYDRFSRSNIMGITALVLSGIMLLCPSSWLLPQSLPHLLIFVALYQLLLASLAACYPVMLTELFPTQIRNTGIAISYNTAFLVAALLHTTVAPHIIATPQLSISYLVWMMTLLTLLALPCTRTFRT